MIYVVTFVMIFLAGTMFLSSVLQSKIVFPATIQMYTGPEFAAWNGEVVKLDVMGESTVGWYFPIPDAKGTVLFSHGNGGNISLWIHAIDVYRDLGLNVLLYDYGGYGQSTGSPSEKRCYADIRAMWDWLTQAKGIAPKSIVLVGRSLGGGVTSHLAAEVTPGAVSLESTFLSATKVGKEALPILPIGLILRHKFDTESRIVQFSAPVLVCHGKHDEVIPYHHGPDLYEKITQPKHFLEIQGGHNDGYERSRKEYAGALSEFVIPKLTQ
jgi:fermentation-respiration switch protein FrsA (DUF1100 family)